MNKNLSRHNPINKNYTPEMSVAISMMDNKKCLIFVLQDYQNFKEAPLCFREGFQERYMKLDEKRRKDAERLLGITPKHFGIIENEKCAIKIEVEDSIFYQVKDRSKSRHSFKGKCIAKNKRLMPEHFVYDKGCYAHGWDKGKHSFESTAKNRAKEKFAKKEIKDFFNADKEESNYFKMLDARWELADENYDILLSLPLSNGTWIF